MMELRHWGSWARKGAGQGFEVLTVPAGALQACEPLATHLRRAPWVAAPGQACVDKAHGGGAVDGDGAVPQLRHRGIKGLAVGGLGEGGMGMGMGVGIQPCLPSRRCMAQAPARHNPSIPPPLPAATRLGGRVNDEARGQRAPGPLVGKLHRRAQEGGRVAAGALQRHLLQHTAPVLVLGVHAVHTLPRLEQPGAGPRAGFQAQLLHALWEALPEGCVRGSTWGLRGWSWVGGGTGLESMEERWPEDARHWATT